MQPLTESLKFRSWKAELEKNGVTINAITEIHSIRKKNGEVLFSLAKIDAKADDGTPLLPVVLLRGHFVSVITWLVNRETKERFLLLVAQRRVANGAISWEHPAGMMDENPDPWAVACIEVEEETGLKIEKTQLRLLWPTLLYSSPGLMDEGGWFFGCELEMSSEGIKAFHNASAGHYGEGEFIHTHIATLEEAKKLVTNTNALLGIYLWNEK